MIRKRTLKYLLLFLILFLCLICLWGVFARRHTRIMEERKSNQDNTVQSTETKEDTENTMQGGNKKAENEADENKKDEGKVDAEEQKESSEEQSVEERVKQIIAGMTLEEKIAQLFIITPEALTGSDCVTQAGEVTRDAIMKRPVGGIIYFSNNLITPEQTVEMLSNTQSYGMERSGFPMFLSVDEEGGKVSRIASNTSFGEKTFRDMWEIGETKDTENAYEVGKTIGAYLHKYGFNLDFAPDVDVLTNPSNQVIGNRSFGSDASLVADMGLAVFKGLEEEQVWACMKHFPGHGATEGDTHEGYAYTSKSLEELQKEELLPFHRGIEEGISFIMVAHIALPGVTGDEEPASLSEGIVTGILREEMGYDGIVITDALNMGAVADSYDSGTVAKKAIEAGVDFLLMPADFDAAYEELLHAVQNGEITEERINQSLQRILKIKLEHNTEK